MCHDCLEHDMARGCSLSSVEALDVAWVDKCSHWGCGVVMWPWRLEAAEETGWGAVSGAQHTAQWAIRRALIPSKAPSELADVLHTDQRRCELSHGEALSSVLTDDEHSQRCVLGSAVCETRL